MVVVAVGLRAAEPITPATHSQIQTHTTMGAITQNRTKKKMLRPIARPVFTVEQERERNFTYHLQ